ncbi:MAG: hypothetical protein Q8P57_04040 [Candidatus Pacearchaeota archaeon]|nr:hypothetical protein [Candidatus Pacearchaeota archaeon]
MKSKKRNLKVIIYSIIALICIVLTFTLNWAFIFPAVLLWWLNKRELGLNKN